MTPENARPQLPPPQVPAPVGGPPPAPAQWAPAWYGPEFEYEEPGTPLSHYIWVLKRHRWKILAFVASCVIGTLIVSARLTPVYESTATVDVDVRTPTGILGPEAARAMTDYNADQFLATQVKLIQSDSVLRPVVRRFKLATEEEEANASRLPTVSREDAPVRLRNLKVTRPPNTYLILISYRSPDPRLAAEVANAIAASYIERTYEIRYNSTMGLSAFMEKQLEELKAKMERSSAALAQFERELNVINPEEKTSILSARLVQLNTEYTNAQADRMRKEAAYNSVRSGSLDAAQASSQGEALKRIIERLHEAEEKFAVAKTHYGANHPEYRKAASQVAQLQKERDDTMRSILRRVEIEYQEALNREEMLKKAVAEVKAEFDRLNARSFEYQALKREAEADKKLYEELVRKIKEAGINAGFQNSSIRLADPARPALKPVYPNLRLNLALAFLFSTLLAIGAAILSDSLDNTVRDPELVRRTMNTEVIGSLPLVKDWRKRKALPAPQAGETTQALVRAGDAPVHLVRSAQSFNEAISTLRNSILLGSFGQPLKSLLVTSAGPAEGKSTIAAHLAVAHARQKHRTLLVDGDLRRPGVHRFFGVGNARGLAQVISNDASWREYVAKVDGLPELDVLTAGPPSRSAAELIGKVLPKMLEEAAAEYDLVILDSPPVLGFPEPLQMAAAVDGVVLVTLAGQTNRKALSSAVATLQRLRANVIGVVMNEVTSAVSDGYYGYYGYYGKYYKYYRDYHRGDEA